MNGMTCKEFDEVVHSFVRMELLDVNLREEALDHAARCGICAERMAQARALAEATETAGKSQRDLQTPPGVEATVMAAFRRHHRHVASRRMFEWAAVGAAAALALVFLWTTMAPSRGQSAPSPRRDVTSRSGQSLNAQAPASTEKNDLTTGAEVEVADASTMESLAGSDFVPVAFTKGISAEDPGMIVRVQLTRASLAELGYPVADAPDEDLIPADVLVGEDGWPRAVRLVQ